MFVHPFSRDCSARAAPAKVAAERVAAGVAHVVGRALAALRSYGSPAVPSWAVRGAQDPQARF